MAHKGFVNHTLMGTLFYAGMWFALYLPNLAGATRGGGPLVWLGLAAYALGVLGGATLHVLVEGNEFTSVTGLITAGVAGWLCARLAQVLAMSPVWVEQARLWGAALGPILLFGSFSLLARRADRRN